MDKNIDLNKLEEENEALRLEISRLRFENDIFRLFSPDRNKGVSYINTLQKYNISSYAELTKYTKKQIGYIPGIGQKFILKVSEFMKDKYNLCFQNKPVDPFLDAPYKGLDYIKKKFAVLAGINIGDKITQNPFNTELEVVDVVVILSSCKRLKLIAYNVKSPDGSCKLVSLDNVSTVNGEKYNNCLRY